MITEEYLIELRLQVLSMIYKYGSQKEQDNVIEHSKKLLNYIVTGKASKKPELE